MKTSILLFFVFIFTGSSAQSVLSRQLFEKLNSPTKQSELLSVNIYLGDKVDFQELNRRLEGASFDTRVKTVYNTLTHFAEESQQDIKNFLNDSKKAKPESIGNIQSFWIINMINIEADSNLILSLSERSDISFMDLNTGRFVIDEPFEIIKSDASYKNNTEASLLRINSHLMWEMGYTGRNVLFLSMDTGVFPDHPAISDNFAGNHWPMSWCWYGVRNPEITDHASSSHGTHTTGTVLGLDPNTNDTIGVAYNAKWIATDPVGGGNQDLLDPVDFMNVFQWVLNPDGDPETTFDVPRVINNSWGYDYSLAIGFDACNLPEAEILVVIETAGICSPFSAGNSGPGASTIGFPAQLTFNEVNTMAVGALNANNTIASFSSRGPSPCIDEDGPLKIKPEVSAPGVNIRSCAGNNSYAYLSGTSMACPHVSGALLLLIEAFPMASAYELKYAIYQTAHDLGEEGEDNVFGRGIIDVFAAYNYLSEIYTPVPPINNDYDIAVNFTFPMSESIICDFEDKPDIEFSIINQGNLSITGFSVKLFHNNMLIIDSILNITLQTGELQQILISEQELIFGKNNLRVLVEPLSEVNEFDIFNNSQIIYFHKIAEAQIPFAEDFSLFPDNINNSEWLIINPDKQKTWELASWDNENKALSINFREFADRNKEEDYALMPSLKIPEWENVYFNFTYAYQRRLEQLYNDSVYIEVSTDCGLNFDQIIYANGGNSLASVHGNSHSVPFIPTTENDFDTVSINLNHYKNKDIIIRFRSVNDRGSRLYIDKVEITDYSYNNSLFHKQSDCFVTLYPNPTKDFLKINKSSCCNTFGIELYEISGKIIYSEYSQDINHSLDITNLKTGIYFLTYKSESVLQTFKIIKN